MSRLYLRILGSFWAVMIALVVGAVGLTWIVLLERSDAAGRAPANLAAEATRALGDGGEKGLAAWLSSAMARHSGYHIFVLDAAGHELLKRPLPLGAAWIVEHGQPPSAKPGEPPPSPLAARLLPPRPLPVLVSANGSEYRLIVLPHRGMVAPFELPWARVALLLLALAVTGVASFWLTRSISGPVADLARATRELASGNLGARVAGTVSRRGDELGGLARDFDAMAGRLQSLVDTKERLLQDVSHELRSPLARMRVALGLARQPGANVGIQLERIELETERLNGLIGQILMLSRLGPETVQLVTERVDVREIIDNIARDGSFEGQARGIVVAWASPPEPVVVSGDATLLASAIENVVRNALRYTADGTTVALELGTDAAAGLVRVVVDDQGSGVPEAELSRIFAPFHRVAESRARESGGDGLGLAITDRVLRAHHGSARAENRAAGGLRVVLELPFAA